MQSGAKTNDIVSDAVFTGAFFEEERILDSRYGVYTLEFSTGTESEFQREWNTLAAAHAYCDCEFTVLFGERSSRNQFLFFGPCPPVPVTVIPGSVGSSMPGLQWLIVRPLQELLCCDGLA